MTDTLLSKTPDITGKVYGRLTVLSFSGYIQSTGRKDSTWLVRCECGVEKVIKGRHTWSCKCDCGKECEVAGSELKRGGVKSCGCARSNHMRDLGRAASKGPLSSLRMVLAGYKSGAKKRGLPFELPPAEFFEMVQMDCFYCGTPPCTQASYSQWVEPAMYNGIDRMDNGLGYVAGNCVTCCKMCNRGKGTMSFQGFMDRLDSLCEYRKSQKEKTIV